MLFLTEEIKETREIGKSLSRYLIDLPTYPLTTYLLYKNCNDALAHYPLVHTFLESIDFIDEAI